MSQVYALPVQVEFGFPVDYLDLLQCCSEHTLEVVHAPVVGAELRLQRYPWDERGLSETDAVKPLCEPGVHVESRCAVRQATDGGLVEGYGVGEKALEVALGKLNDGGSENPLVFILGYPEVKTFDHGSLHCLGVAVVA